MLPYTQYLCRDNLYTCIVLPFFLPFFFTRTILNRDNKSPAKKGLKICLRKSARPTRLPSRSLFLDRTRIPPGFPQDLSVVSAGRIHTVDNIFHRQLAVMSDKSILGEGRLGTTSSCLEGVHAVGRERVRFPTLSYPTFPTSIVLPMIRFDSTRLDSTRGFEPARNNRRGNRSAMDGSIGRS